MVSSQITYHTCKFSDRDFDKRSLQSSYWEEMFWGLRWKAFFFQFSGEEDFDETVFFSFFQSITLLKLEFLNWDLNRRKSAVITVKLSFEIELSHFQWHIVCFSE